MPLSRTHAALAAWLLVPAEGSDRGKVGLDRRSRVVALVGVGVVALAILFGHVWWDSSSGARTVGGRVTAGSRSSRTMRGGATT